MEIRLYLPQTAEDVHAKAEDIQAAFQSVQEDPDEDILEWFAQHPHTLYLFYDGESLLGLIRLDDRAANPALGKNTVEIHGCVMPEYRGHMDEPAFFVMTEAFKVKKNIIAKVNPQNLGAVGFCRKWGFKKINREQGKDVYRLKRSEFNRVVR